MHLLVSRCGVVLVLYGLKCTSYLESKYRLVLTYGRAAPGLDEGVQPYSHLRLGIRIDTGGSTGNTSFLLF